MSTITITEMYAARTTESSRDRLLLSASATSLATQTWGEGIQLGRHVWSLKYQESMMALGVGSRQAADEEARAEVEVRSRRSCSLISVCLKC
jgi:hypothetical protein